MRSLAEDATSFAKSRPGVRPLGCYKTRCSKGRPSPQAPPSCVKKTRSAIVAFFGLGITGHLRLFYGGN